MKKEIKCAALILAASLALCGCNGKNGETNASGGNTEAFEVQHKTETETVEVTGGFFPWTITQKVTYVQKTADGDWEVESRETTGGETPEFEFADTVWIIEAKDVADICPTCSDDLKGHSCKAYFHFDYDTTQTLSRRPNEDGTFTWVCEIHGTADLFLNCSGFKYTLDDFRVSLVEMNQDGTSIVTVDMGLGVGDEELYFPAQMEQVEWKDYLIAESETYLTNIEFADLPTFDVTSETLNHGIWDLKIANTSKGEKISPELSWEAVDGATQYVVIMIDGTWLHMDVFTTETSLEEGAFDRGERGAQYVGPYPPEGIPHTYSVFVFALKGDMGDVTMHFDAGGNSINTIYSDLDKDADGNTGNVIAYGRLDGNFTNL